MITFEVRMDLTELEATLRANMKNANEKLMKQVLTDTDFYLPMLTGSLKQRTHIVGDTIIYPGPYARYLYNGKAMKDPVHGGPFYIPEVGWRFRKYAKLVPTNRDLHYTKDAHPGATSHWFEVSKQKNLKRWLEVAEKAVNDG